MRKRRLAVVAAVALAIAVIAPLIGPSAGAVVGNPGKIAVSMRLSLFTPTFSFPEMSTVGTGTATVRKNGVINIPKPNLSFDPVDVQVALPVSTTTQPPDTTPDTSTVTAGPPPPVIAKSTVTVQAFPTSDFRGVIDPKTGAAFLLGNVELLISQDGTMTDCPVGPFQIIARTNAQGGDVYSSETGTVTMVDSGFTIEAIPGGSTGCAGFESAINTAISLPVTTTTTTTTLGSSTTTSTTFPPGTDPPVPAVVLSLTFVPALQTATDKPVTGHGNQPATTATEKTTTTPSTAAPVVTPAPGQGQGPGQGTANPSNPAPQHRKNVVHKPRTNPNKKHHPKKSKKKNYPNTNPNKVNHGKKVKKKGKGVFAVPSAKSTGAHKRTPGTYLPGGHPAAARPKPTVPAASAPQSRRLTFVTAAFVKRPTALSTGLDLIGLLGLLVFSTLALWLVTTEVSAFSASARRQRSHRIAGVTRRS